MLRPIKLASALLLPPAFVLAQTTSQLTSLTDRLDRLEQENRALTQEIQDLRAQLATFRDATERSQSVTDGKVELQQRRIEEHDQAKVEASQKFPIRLAGMALFNAFADSRQSGGTDYPVVAAPTGPGHAGATIRQSILGLEFRGPQTLWGGHIQGSIYMDFFSGTPPLGQTMRLRTGSIEVDWASRSVMVGIEKPIFNPREPSSLAQVGVSPLTGAGNLWLWLPQVRVEQDLSWGAQNGLRAQLGAVQTREAGPYAGSIQSGNLEANRPGLEGRFEFYHKFDDDRRLEVAPGFHVSSTHVAGFSVPSQVFSFDWFVNPLRWFEFTGAFYHGENVALLGSGYRQGFGLYQSEADAVHSQGGWGQFTFHLLRRVDLHLLSGQQDDRNSDLVTGNISKNLFFGGNLYFRLAPNVILSPEVSQVRTVYVGQGTRLNNHYDLALGYLF